MRDFAKISPKFWMGHTGRVIRELGPEAQITALYLLTSPHSNMLGLYYCPITYISHDTGSPLEGASKALLSLIEGYFCAYDFAAEMVWVFEMAKFQISDQLLPQDKRCTGIQNMYNELPANAYLGDFFDKYASRFNLKTKRENVILEKPLPRGLQGASKPLRSKEKEKEKEKEKYKLQNQCRADALAVGEVVESLPATICHTNNGRLASVVQAVVEHYKQFHPRSYRVMPDAKSKEAKLIKERVAEGSTVEQLCSAIDGMHRTPHNLGATNGTKYLALTLCLRNREQVDRFVENSISPPAFAGPSKSLLREAEQRRMIDTYNAGALDESAEMV